MTRLSAFTLVAALCLAAPAHAAINGSELLMRCSASEKSMTGAKLSAKEVLDSTWCAGYLSGLLDGFGVSDYRVGKERMVCPPQDNLTPSQALAIINRYLREHPEEQEKSGRRNALLALGKAMPCGRAAKSD